MIDINTFHTGDWGILFKFRLINKDTNAVVDISAATNKYMYFKRPDGTSFIKTAAFSTDGTDGYIQYVSVADDLDAVGEWLIQGFVELPTKGVATEKIKFKVKATIYTAP